MRQATKEEKESVINYVESISVDTDINFYTIRQNEVRRMNKEEICCGNCDKCELGVPIDGQFYDDGSPICECSIPVKKNPRDLTDWELERFMAHGHPICDCEQKCDKCPEWMANICNNYDYYEKKYKKEGAEE